MSSWGSSRDARCDPRVSTSRKKLCGRGRARVHNGLRADLRCCGNDAAGQLGQPSTPKLPMTRGTRVTCISHDGGQPTRRTGAVPGQDRRHRPQGGRRRRPRRDHVDSRHHGRQRRPADLPDEFSTDPANPLPYSTVAWTITAYTLALATVIPLTGWAADRFGTKRPYLLALALFTAGSALCATADSIGMLIFFRVLQGFGGGMLMPLGMTIMTRAAGPARMGRLMAILGVPMLLGPIFGPILGGWLIEVTYLALDLPHQPADRHRRDLLRLGRCPPTDRPRAVRVVRRHRHAPHVARSRALPLRDQLHSRRGHLLLAQGRACPRRIGADHAPHLRPLQLPAEAPAARPAPLRRPEPHGLDDHDVPLRGLLLRGALPRADVLPTRPGRESGRLPVGWSRHKASVRWSPCPSPARSRTGSPWAASSPSACCSSSAACSH